MNEQQELFDDIKKFVDDSRVLLAKGVEVEMAGLDRKVQNLCNRVMQLSDDERAKYVDILQTLLGELNQLGHDLAVQREAVLHEIRYLSSHKKASVAYKVADAKAPANGQDE